jgi:small subunit ribosomal protein S1
VRGRVTKVVTFGAFVEIVPGVEGLVHISELAAHHVENPREVVTQGDDTPVKIIEVDADRRRLSLSIKRVEPEDEILASIELEGLPPRRESLPADSDAEDDPRYSAAAYNVAEIEASLPSETIEDGVSEPQPEGVEDADAVAETPEEAEAEAIAVDEPEVEPETSHAGEPGEEPEAPAEEPEAQAAPDAAPEAEAAPEAAAAPEAEAGASVEAEPEAAAEAEPQPEAAPEARPEPELGLSDDVFGDAADGEVTPADEPADAPA